MSSRAKKPTEERFWSKVQILQENECWIWQGSTNRAGYGRIFVERGKYEMTHRFSYFLHYGIEPSKYQVCHSCDNPPCVNPHHLWLGTATENAQDCKNKGRHNYGTAQGESHPNVSLTDAQVIEIRNLFANCRTIQEIATQYEMSHGAISHIVKGRSWKHLL